MYDNLDLILKKDTCNNINFIEQTPQYLTNVSTVGQSQYGDYITGYLDNLKVSISDNRVKIYDSSICKYYLGNNFKTLSKGDTQKAIQKISDYLHLPFYNSDVTRIDFSQNMIMKYDTKVYFSYLGEAQYYNRLEQNNGLYYNNQKRQLLFYGKVQEQTLKGQNIPELYKNRNVLRFEMRFRKRLSQQLNQPEIKAKLLYDEEFYKYLVKRWKNEYLSIQKINSKLKTMQPTGSQKQLIDNLALLTVLEIGQPNILNKIKEWQISGKISKKQAYDLRLKIKQISNIPKNKNDNEIIKELDKKIKETARNW